MGDDALHMTSHRPYLLRALYEWVVDNGMTPHVLVDATLPGVRVPMQSVKDGRIVLNIAERAVGGLRMDNDALRFSARFGGVSQSVLVPLEAVIAVYSRETGQGMALPEDPRAAPASMATEPAIASEKELPEPDDSGPDSPSEPPKRGAHLRIVK